MNAIANTNRLTAQQLLQIEAHFKDASLCFAADEVRRDAADLIEEIRQLQTENSQLRTSLGARRYANQCALVLTFRTAEPADMSGVCDVLQDWAHESSDNLAAQIFDETGIEGTITAVNTI